MGCEGGDAQDGREPGTLEGEDEGGHVGVGGGQPYRCPWPAPEGRAIVVGFRPTSCASQGRCSLLRFAILGAAVFVLGVILPQVTSVSIGPKGTAAEFIGDPARGPVGHANRTRSNSALETRTAAASSP